MKTIIAILFLSLSLQGYSQGDANQLIRYDRNESAAKLLHQQLQKDPADAGSWYLLARTYADKEKANAGLDSIEKASPVIHGDPYYQIAKGLLLLESGKAAEADGYFGNAIDETRGKNADILAAVAEAHISSKNGDYNKAISLLEKAIKRDKKNARLSILMGNAYRMLHKGSEAYNAYHQALDKDPASAEANYQLALIFLTQNNHDLVTEYLNKSVQLDPNDPRPLYELYRYHFARDPQISLKYFEAYQAKSDRDKDDEYALTDLLYLTKQYDQAISNAERLLANKEEPRLYKLLAYSHLGLQDTVRATGFMREYFATEADSNLVIKDFETMATLYMQNGNPDSALLLTEKVLARTEDQEDKNQLYKKLATIARSASDHEAEAKWLELFYGNSPKATNVDLFNWGLAHFKAKKFEKADSVFQLYTVKYPEQGFGYYWRAKSNAAIDPEMKKGLAVPVYTELINVLKSDTTGNINTQWMVEAYGYLAAYEANVNNNYSQAVKYFKDILLYDPGNQDAEKYIGILEKRIENSEGSK